MPLLTCPDCQKLISDSAKCCPGCGLELTAEKIKSIRDQAEIALENQRDIERKCGGCVLVAIFVVVMVVIVLQVVKEDESGGLKYQAPNTTKSETVKRETYRRLGNTRSSNELSSTTKRESKPTTLSQANAKQQPPVSIRWKSLYQLAKASTAYGLAEEPVVLLLEFDGNQGIVVIALYTREDHELTYTTRPPTYLKLKGREYIPMTMFFSQNFEGILTADGEKIAELKAVDGSRLAGSVDLASKIKNLKDTTHVTLNYASYSEGLGQRIKFPAADILKNFNTTPTSPDPKSPPDISAIDLVANALQTANQFGITHSKLLEHQNPHGEGVFVYVPKFRVAGYDRYAIWFVFGGQAYALNSPAKTVTPSLPFPRERPAAIWSVTGMQSSEVTSIGIKAVYGRR